MDKLKADAGGGIDAALSLPGVERLREWAAIGPVQRAAVEAFADGMTPCDGCTSKLNPQGWCLNCPKWAAGVKTPLEGKP